MGKNFKHNKALNIRLPKKRVLDAERFGYDFIINSAQFIRLEVQVTSSGAMKICNRLEENEHICSKKLLFLNLKNYFEKLNKKAFDIIPVTFHAKAAHKDDGFTEFETYFNESAQTGSRNIWIIKPGENTNRGKGITVSSSLEEIRQIVSDKCAAHTYIIQKYIENPLLINKRKFDIRCFVLMTSINSNIQGYFYTEGYIRTSSKEFTMKNLESKYIHLTNDAIQKNSEDYGKFEPANKMSYSDMQNYINLTHPEANINFERDILTQIRNIVVHSIHAIFRKIDPSKRLHSFELFGYDFMVDENFKVWLIEANTNPCLETSCAFLSRIIPACIDNTFRLVLDPLFPPPFENKKLASWLDDAHIGNKFELVFNEFNIIDS